MINELKKVIKKEIKEDKKGSALKKIIKVVAPKLDHIKLEKLSF